MTDEIDPVAVRQLALQQNQARMIREVQQEDREFAENELRVDPTWGASSRILYEAYNGSKFEGTDEEAGQYGLDQMSNQLFAFYNLDTWSDEDNKGLAEVMQSWDGFSDDQKLAFGYMSLIYDQKDVSWAGTGRAFRALVNDPTNLATIGGPLALFFKATGRTAAKAGFQLVVRDWLKKHPIIKAAALTGTEGAAFTTIDDQLRFNAHNGFVETTEDVAPYYNVDEQEMTAGRRAVSAGTGFGFGSILGASVVAAPIAKRAVDEVMDSVGDLFNVKDVEMPAVPQPFPGKDAPFDPKDLHSRMHTLPLKTKTEKGKLVYVGAPAQKKTPQAFQGLIKKLLPRINSKLAMTDKSLTWYEDAGAHIDHITRGDPVLKERMVRFLAIYSANADVMSNTAAALEAAFQHAKGDLPFTGKTPNVTAAEIENLLSIPEFDTRAHLVGNKIMNFYRNLRDPAFGRNDFDDAVTIDRHMLTMFGYKASSRGDDQYAYAQHLVKEITRKYNEQHGTDYLPRQIQAALWTDERNTKLLAEGSAVSFTGFNEELARATSHITWEANTPLYPEFGNLTQAEQLQFTQEARQLLLDQDGNDIILSHILKHPLYKHMAAEGSWEGVISPNTQSALVLPRIEGKTGGPFDPSIAKLYASMMGYIYHQDAVPWLRFDPNLDVNAPTNNQGWAIVVSESEATPDFTTALYDHIGNAVEGIEFTRINLPKGKVAYSFINFRDPETGTPFGLSDADFLAKIEAATKGFDNQFEGLAGEVDAYPIVNEGELLFKGDNYEGYHSQISALGSPDLLDWGSGRRTAFEQLIESWKKHGAEIPKGEPF